MVRTVMEKKVDGGDVYSVLRDDIINLRLRPGAFFSIRDLCAFYNVGRSPGREALIRLEQEGLVTFLPQRGTMISKLDLERIDNERYIRRSIEENVMRDFVGMFSNSVILHLEEMIREQRVLHKGGDHRGFLDADDRFHRVFYQGAEREYCCDVIDKECSNYRRMRLLAQMTDNDAMEKTIEEHVQLVNAVALRDMERVMSCFSLHLDQIKSQERKILRRFGDLFQNVSGAERKENPDLDTDFLLSIRGRGL